MKKIAKKERWIKLVAVEEDRSPRGNWNTAMGWFPDIEVDQETGVVTITSYNSSGYQEKATVTTKSLGINQDKKRNCTQAYIRGEVDVRNWRNHKCSGSQKFVFAVFLGDDGHIYTHRAAAQKTWMEADAGNIRQRIRELGGWKLGSIQQGDILFVPARNGGQLPDSNFKHEIEAVGHHRFSRPILSAEKEMADTYRTHILVDRRPLKVKHRGDEGRRHPAVEIPVGQYYITTTHQGLRGTTRD